jgi:uncharacterized membrane protein
MKSPPVQLRLALLGFVFVAVIVSAPVVGWPSVVRLPAVVVPAVALAIVSLQPWRWTASRWNTIDEWQPGTRTIIVSAAAIGLLLFWIVLTRFMSGHINAVDFTVYFDRPCYQTVYKRLPLFVETADVPSLSNRSELAVHAFWAMFPVCAAYALYPTPHWLLIIAIIAVVGGAIHVLRVGQAVGYGGVLASATALAFVFNDNTARTLTGGFHPEVLYAWFLPWLLDAGIHRARRSYMAAALACVLVKEDAFLILVAAAVCLALVRNQPMTRGDRLVFLVMPTAIALLNVVAFYRFVVPALTPGGTVTYAAYWSNYGSTPLKAVPAMISRPSRVLLDTVTSGLLPIVMPPHLFLPLIGWRWCVGTVPIVALYGASANPQLRAFGIYYTIILVPFLALAASAGGLVLIRRWIPYRAHVWAAAVVVLGALLVGGDRAGYSLRPWRPEVAGVRDAISQLASERVVLVQSGLYVHAGYSSSVKLLTREGLRDPHNADAAILIAPSIGGYPFTEEELRKLAHLPLIRRTSAGLIAVRNRGE